MRALFMVLFVLEIKIYIKLTWSNDSSKIYIPYGSCNFYVSQTKKDMGPYPTGDFIYINHAPIFTK